MIHTDAILSLDDDAAISTEEMEFAFQVWLHFQDRLVGFPSRSHFWDDRKHQWVSPTVWKFHYFANTKILREINLGYSRSAKSAIFTHLQALNFEYL